MKIEMPPLSQRIVNIVAIAAATAWTGWTLWDTAIFYLASPASLLSVAQITVAILFGLGMLAIIIPKKRRGAALRGFYFAMMICCGAMFVVTALLFTWLGFRYGFSWEMAAFPAVMAGMCFSSYREWRS